MVGGLGCVWAKLNVVPLGRDGEFAGVEVVDGVVLGGGGLAGRGAGPGGFLCIGAIGGEFALGQADEGHGGWGSLTSWLASWAGCAFRD